MNETEQSWARIVAEESAKVDRLLFEAAGLHWRSLPGLRRELVTGDGRVLSEIDLVRWPLARIRSWATAHLRIPRMDVISAIEADEGEG